MLQIACPRLRYACTLALSPHLGIVMDARLLLQRRQRRELGDRAPTHIQTCDYHLYERVTLGVNGYSPHRECFAPKDRMRLKVLQQLPVLRTR